MLRRVKSMRGFKILANDGEIGKVDEFYFDDHTWTIRYLIADTGNWLLSNLVLISTHALKQPKWEEKLFPVKLTKQQIEDSPKIETDKPVSRQYETELINYYGWPNYWAGMGGPVIGAIPPLPAEIPDEKKEKEERENNIVKDPNLRSTDEVIDYNIGAEDGDIGHIENFLADDKDWKIRYIIVDTQNWLPGGRKVILSVNWIKKIVWEESKVKINLSKKAIKNSPEFDSEIINREYENQLYEYYEKPKYWR